jgi:hypothetical protein
MQLWRLQVSLDFMFRYRLGVGLMMKEVATGRPEAQRFREGLIYPYEMRGHYPADWDITNEILRMTRTAISQDAVSFTQLVFCILRNGVSVLIMILAM